MFGLMKYLRVLTGFLFLVLCLTGFRVFYGLDLLNNQRTVTFKKVIISR